LPEFTLYFPLHNIIIFLALDVKVTLPKTKNLYFPSSWHILPTRILMYFPLDDFIFFLAPREVALRENEHLYFPSSKCVFSRVVVRTSSILWWFYYFCSTSQELWTSQCWTLVLLFVTFCISCRHCVYFMTLSCVLSIIEVLHFSKRDHVLPIVTIYCVYFLHLYMVFLFFTLYRYYTSENWYVYFSSFTCTSWSHCVYFQIFIEDFISSATITED
jgi:hypothetical protein